jgi:tetratricopeptide (TPR) repeat protein
MQALRQTLNAVYRTRTGLGLLYTLICCLLALHPAFVARVYGQATQDSLKQHYTAAQDSLRTGDQDHAAIEYKEFLGEALHRVANARALTGQMDEASRTFDEALPFTGADAAIRMDYASVLFDGGRFKEARPIAQLVVDAQPTNRKAHILLGRINFEDKDYPAAREQFVAAGSSSLREVWRPLAMTYLRMQDLSAARTLLQRVIATLGDTPANRLSIATAYYYGDYPDQAIAELKKILPGPSPPPEAHYYLGLAYLSRNEEAGYAKAMPEFRAALQLRPQDFASSYMLGYILIKQRNFDQAEQELDRASSLNPADAGTQLLLGELYAETRRSAKAETVLQKLIASSNPDAPDNTLIRAHYMLGRLLRDEGKLAEGAAEIAKSEQLRRKLRLSSTEASENGVARGIKPDVKQLDASSGSHRSTPASANETAQAQDFIAKLSPAIGEAYYNLAAIASQHHDSATTAQYMQRAATWDPSLATGGQR